MIRYTAPETLQDPITTRHTALVIDDHPLFGRGIADFLKTHCGFTQTLVFTDCSQLTTGLAGQHLPSLAVVDYWLLKGAALSLLQRLRLQFPKICLLVISADDHPDIQRAAKAAGANGFLHKQQTPDIFVQAVATLMTGGFWFTQMPPALAAFPVRERHINSETLGLTPRQGEVLALMLKGLPNKRIAQHLLLTEQTVKQHVSAILERLGASSRVQVITMLQGKLFEPGIPKNPD